MPHYTQGSICDTVNEIVKLARITYARKNLKVQSDISLVRHLYPTLLFDKRRLHQVLSNIISNAAKF